MTTVRQKLLQQIDDAASTMSNYKSNDIDIPNKRQLFGGSKLSKQKLKLINTV